MLHTNVGRPCVCQLINPTHAQSHTAASAARSRASGRGEHRAIAPPRSPINTKTKPHEPTHLLDVALEPRNERCHLLVHRLAPAKAAQHGHGMARVCLCLLVDVSCDGYVMWIYMVQWGWSERWVDFD